MQSLYFKNSFFTNVLVNVTSVQCGEGKVTLSRLATKLNKLLAVPPLLLYFFFFEF